MITNELNIGKSSAYSILIRELQLRKLSAKRKKCILAMLLLIRMYKPVSSYGEIQSR